LDSTGSAAGKEGTVPVFYCVPIISLQQEVIGCLQASPSAKSPPLKSALRHEASEGIHTITFQDAMGWAGYLLSSKVGSVLSASIIKLPPAFVHSY
jgi:hypothetical protein